MNKGPGALSLSRERDAWDLLEIYFMEPDIRSIEAGTKKTDADFVVFERDRMKRKFAIIKAIFRSDSFWRHYERVMMADDDVIPVGCNFSDIFNLFERAGARFGQPALTHDSFYSHIVTLQNMNFVWRRTNFSEVMCPIFTREALADHLDSFDETISGFGLDILWSFVEWTKHGGAAILDATPIRHTRPVGAGVAYRGLTAHDELRQFVMSRRLPIVPQCCYGGKTSGKAIDDVLTGQTWADAYARVSALDQPRVRHHLRTEAAIIDLCMKINPDFLLNVENATDSARITHVAAVSLRMIDPVRQCPLPRETALRRSLRLGKLPMRRLRDICRRIFHLKLGSKICGGESDSYGSRRAPPDNWTAVL